MYFHCLGHISEHNVRFCGVHMRTLLTTKFYCNAESDTMLLRSNLDNVCETRMFERNYQFVVVNCGIKSQCPPPKMNIISKFLIIYFLLKFIYSLKHANIFNGDIMYLSRKVIQLRYYKFSVNVIFLNLFP